MTSRLAGELVSECEKCLRETVPLKDLVAVSSYSDNFVPDEVQPDDVRRACFVEVAANGVANFLVQPGQVIGLGEDRLAQRPRREPSLGVFCHHEDYFVHESKDTRLS